MGGVSKDLAAGLAAVALGAAVVWYGSDYSLGTPRRMGPGFFPVVLGALLAVTGLAIMATALRSWERMPRLNLRPLVVLPLALLLFALLLDRVGYAPAGFLAVIVAGFAERRPALVQLLLLALVLVPATWLLFGYALGVPLRLFAWSF